MSLGSRIKAARNTAKKTQDQVAEALGVTKGAVSQWENGGTIPELEYFMEFCRYTKASADEVLLDRKQDPLLHQLVTLYSELTPDSRDTLLGNANRLHNRDHPGSSPANPFGSITPPVKPKPTQGERRKIRS